MRRILFDVAPEIRARFSFFFFEDIDERADARLNSRVRGMRIYFEVAEYIAGKMIPDNEGKFTRTFSGENVHPNFRNFDLGWLDYQFVGSNVHGVIGRSQKIERTVTYTKECPQ